MQTLKFRAIQPKACVDEVSGDCCPVALRGERRGRLSVPLRRLRSIGHRRYTASSLEEGLWNNKADMWSWEPLHLLNALQSTTRSPLRTGGGGGVYSRRRGPSFVCFLVFLQVKCCCIHFKLFVCLARGMTEAVCRHGSALLQAETSLLQQGGGGHRRESWCFSTWSSPVSLTTVFLCQSAEICSVFLGGISLIKKCLDSRQSESFPSADVH